MKPIVMFLNFLKLFYSSSIKNNYEIFNIPVITMVSALYVNVEPVGAKAFIASNFKAIDAKILFQRLF